MKAMVEQSRKMDATLSLLANMRSEAPTRWYKAESLQHEENTIACDKRLNDKRSPGKGPGIAC